MRKETLLKGPSGIVTLAQTAPARRVPEKETEEGRGRESVSSSVFTMETTTTTAAAFVSVAGVPSRVGATEEKL